MAALTAINEPDIKTVNPVDSDLKIENPFVLPKDKYVRDLDIKKGYEEDMCHILARSRGISLAEAKKALDFILSEDGPHPKKNPRIRMLSKEKPGHRVRMTISLDEYFDDIVNNKRLISPTFTVYYNPHQKKSILAKFTQQNIKDRKVLKAEKFKAEGMRDEERAVLYDILQGNKKISNNSLSGAHASRFTMLYNKSAHSTLTSTCRSGSGYGNANNEKLISGNRHYWCFDVTIANIASICNMTDRDQFKRVMEKYDLHYPTADDVMEVVTRSSSFYWTNDRFLTDVRNYVEGLEPLERAMFTYVGDLYHIRKFNSDFMRKALNGFLSSDHTEHPAPENVISKLTGDLKVLTNYVGQDFLKGDNLQTLQEKKDTKRIAMFASTAKKMVETIDEFSDFWRAMLATPSVPASVAKLPSIVRRTAIASDTDSTIFTLQEWVQWHQGEINFSHEANNLRDSLVYIASQSIIHVLAVMSRNLGCDDETLHMFSMKNEYVFDIFARTQRAKHYYAAQSRCEGVIYDKPKLELKGVGLKATTSPPELVAICHNSIQRAMSMVVAGKKMSFFEEMGKIADLERGIKASVLKGESKYLKSNEMKPASTYKNKEEAPVYQGHLLWNDVFAPKYGSSPDLPYSAVRVNLDITSKSDFQNWIASIKDKAFKERVVEWTKRNPGKMICTLYVPKEFTSSNGLPEEILDWVDVRKIITTNMDCFYLMLESWGIQLKDKKQSQLVSDLY